MKTKKALLLICPGLIILFICMALPLLEVLLPTVFTGDYFLSYYIEFLKDAYYQKIFLRTLKIAIISTLICMFLGIPTGYFISRCHKKWRAILLAIALFPMLTNSVIRSFAWINILGTNGVINKLLLYIGIIDQPLQILYTEYAIIIGSIYLFLPLMIVTVTGCMENINNDLMEAALSLGVNHFQAFIQVIFPISLPGVIVGGILVFTGSLTAYTTPQLLGGNSNLVLSTFIYQRSMSMRDWTSASVIAVIMIVTTIIVMKLFSLLSDYLDKRGE